MAERRLTAELVAIGDELLLGEYVDGNSRWLSERLAEAGVDVCRHHTVGDDVAVIAEVLAEACERADVVIAGGGLGPTSDDRTRAAAARAAGVELRRDPELVRAVREQFARRGRPMPESNLVQADLPEGAQAIPPVGTAPGFSLELRGCLLFCLPGVPSELEVMAADHVLPRIAARTNGATTLTRVVRTAGIAEAAVGEICAPLVERVGASGDLVIAFLASRGETRVKVTARAADRDTAEKRCAPVVAELLDLLGPNVTGVDEEGVESAVARQLKSLGWTLAVGESITGGGVGGRLVAVTGASDWFRGGLITYATDTKVDLAGVDPGLLAEHSPVSEPTALALAAGARERLGADVGLGVVGVAGPTMQGGQPVGTVAFGVVGPDGLERTATTRLPSVGRAAIQEFAVSAALDYLRRRLAAVRTSSPA